MTCGILNLSDCIMNKFGDFILTIVNAPLLPLLNGIKILVTTPVDVSVFSSLWAVIVYVISTFYGLFILAAGFNFIISGYSFEKRERAKEWLQNTVLMILAVQSSFLAYQVMADLASGLTSGVINMIDPNFFLITLNDPVNLGLEIFLGTFYGITLMLTMIVFSITYLLSAVGVLFFPFGLFFYFIPPMKDMGRFIISKLLFVLFLPFFACLILLGAGEIVKLPYFSSIKIMLMIGAFGLVNLLMVLLAVLAVFRAVTTVMNSGVVKGLLFFKGQFLAAALTPKTEEPRNEREYWGKPRYDRGRGRYG